VFYSDVRTYIDALPSELSRSSKMGHAKQWADRTGVICL